MPFKTNLIQKAGTVAILLFSLTACGQKKYTDVIEQKMTAAQWNAEAKTDIRLLPKYGYVPKTAAQKDADKKFIEATLKQYPTKREASDHIIELGFKHLYKEIKTAMYRFNQAYLLDSTNTDIYWGYGGVYMVLGDWVNAQKQYLEGLSINSQNTHLLTDYGTYFMNQCTMQQPSDERKALSSLDSAISYLTKSYQIDSKNPNTTFKLAVCYYQRMDCTNARKYYEECKAAGGQPITAELTKAMTEECAGQ